MNGFQKNLATRTLIQDIQVWTMNHISGLIGIQAARQSIVDLLPHNTTNLIVVNTIPGRTQYIFPLLPVVVIRLLLIHIRPRYMLNLPLFNYLLAHLIVHLPLNLTMRQRSISLDLTNLPLNRNRGFHSHLLPAVARLQLQSQNTPPTLKHKGTATAEEFLPRIIPERTLYPIIESSVTSPSVDGDNALGVSSGLENRNGGGGGGGGDDVPDDGNHVHFRL